MCVVGDKEHCMKTHSVTARYIQDIRLSKSAPDREARSSGTEAVLKISGEKNKAKHKRNQFCNYNKAIQEIYTSGFSKLGGEGRLHILHTPVNMK